MARPFKIFLIIIGVVLALLISAAVALPLLFDPNNYRDDIQRTVKDNTGREFTLGDIKLHVFPWLAVRVADVKLGNAAGFGAEPFAQVSEANVGVQLLPLLFSKKVVVSTVTVKGLKLNLAKNKEGLSNWADLSEEKPQREEKPPKPQGKNGFKTSDLNIGGVDIQNAVLSYADAQTGKSYRVENLNLTTGKVKPGQPFDFKLALALLSTAPELKAAITLAGTLDADLKSDLVKLPGLKLSLKATGKDLSAGAEFTADSKFNLQTQLLEMDGVKLQGSASGQSIPGGQQDLALTGNLRFDAKQGALKFANAVLQAAGLTLNTEINGENLLGDAPRLSGPIRIQKFSPRELLARLGRNAPETADKNVLNEMSVNASYSGSFKSAALKDLSLKLDQTSASGSLNIRDFATQAIEFALKVDQLDVDRYLPPKRDKPAGPAEEGKKGNVNDIQIPAETLDNLNAVGTLDVGLLKINGIKLSDARVKLGGGKGEVKTQDISAKLYGGSIALNSRVAPGARPQYAAKTRLTALNAGPFLQDFLGKDYISGIGNFNLDVTSAGLTVGDLRKSLNGDIGFKVENGAVKGFNLAGILRKGQALLSGNLNYSETSPQQTDFAAITGSAKIINGVLKSDTLNAASPLFRLLGNGEIDLVNETISYLAKPTIVETSTGQGGKDLEQLRGITIPIRLSGNLFAPSYKLDLEAALKQKALSKFADKIDINKEQLKAKEDEVRDQLKQKLNDRLNKLFGPRQPEPTPQQPAPAPAEQPKPQA